MELIQQKHAVGGQSAKEESEISSEDNNLFELLASFLLQAFFLRLFVGHVVFPLIDSTRSQLFSI